MMNRKCFSFIMLLCTLLSSGHGFQLPPAPLLLVQLSQQQRSIGTPASTTCTTTTTRRWRVDALRESRRPKFTEISGSPDAMAVIKNTACTAVVAASLMLHPLPSPAYDPSDYASQTVQEALKSLKDASGDSQLTFKAYENIADIITEGKGVGGSINYKGVQLQRGYIADEDTSIYNPGLTLLTESEKGRLVEAVIEARKSGLSVGQWSQDNEFGYEFLRGKLDPLHMYELQGYLSIFPFYAAIVYVAVLAVQQFINSLFPAAYFIGVLGIFLPIVALVAKGP